MKKLPSQEELLARYYYDAFDGILYHKENVSQCIKANTPCLSKNVQGYVRTKIKQTTYTVHRIIWKMVYNSEPEIIDHINRNKSDNRLSNLRSVSTRQNLWNKAIFDKQVIGSCRRKTATGFVYDSYYRYNKKRYFLGTFATREEAHKKYMEVHNSPCKDFLQSD